MDTIRDSKKLPVLAIFSEALALPRKHFHSLIRYGLPVLVLGLFTTVFTSPQIGGGGFSGLLGGIFGLAFGLCLVMGIVSCHRIFLLDSEIANSTPVWRWTIRETRYLIGWITISVVTLALALSVMPFVVPMLDDMSGAVGNDGFLYWLLSNALYVPLMYIISRLMILLPAIAVGSVRRGMGAAWQLSKNNGWRLTILIGLPAFVSHQVFTLFEYFETFPMFILEFFFWLFLGLIELGILSLSYAWLRDNSSSESKPAQINIQKTD
ncbi:hypothetical protein [Aliamphritea ceti]|uniref:hypothetical protein n=1 Tax=Aliamphritea ceti TaxID=1524258 RepID=UPI0021C3926A|nr:hypothetical protein [Aliamphritea ceti]